MGGFGGVFEGTRVICEGARADPVPGNRSFSLKSDAGGDKVDPLDGQVSQVDHAEQERWLN